MGIATFVRLEDAEVGQALIAIEATDALGHDVKNTREAFCGLLSRIGSVVLVSEGDKHVGMTVASQALETSLTVRLTFFTAPASTLKAGDLSVAMGKLDE